MVGWADSNYLGWVEFRVIRVFRVPWPNTRTTRINFGYHGLEPGLEFEFFGWGFLGTGSGFFGSIFGYQVFCPAIVVLFARLCVMERFFWVAWAMWQQ